ncbi:hypothetical protein IFR04_002576 [Cadophora malorum]|uniref:2EXR domain-containing protein n=1 Tax=Cadophora malorum TaxID=108018 RepID=A0A8H7WGD4_9HELO|nr:hypothetical protein IFR04_002576 [Cadophora malorum]
MDEFARITTRVPDFLLDPTILTLTRFPRHKLGHVRDHLASLSPPDASFPQFSKLPAEIRLKIWRYALPGRRRIAINKTKLRDWEWASKFPGIEHDLYRIKHLALRGRTAAFHCLATDPNGQQFYPAWILEPFHSLETLFIDDRARHSFPTKSSILAGIPIDRMLHFAKEDEIEESWLRHEREREERAKIVNLPAWSKMYVPLARLGL